MAEPRLDPNREPAADLRVAARQLRELFVSLVNEGFTEHQALRIVGQVLGGQRGGSG